MLESRATIDELYTIPESGLTMLRSLHKSLLAFGLLAFVVSAADAQQHLPQQRWQLLGSENFEFISQLSANQTERLAQEFELWRSLAGRLISGSGTLPTAAIKNHVYVFANRDSLEWFTYSSEAGAFYQTPRRNFSVLVYQDEESLKLVRHHYVHFLMRNFTDLRMPRWYEEGLAAYLANLEVTTDSARMATYSAEDFSLALQLSPEVTVEELLFDEAQLASPRRIQIANMKSETLLYFLLHGQQEGFGDRRVELQEYLALSVAGRTQRYAFDQAFTLTAAQLDADYARFLQESGRARAELQTGELMSGPRGEAVAAGVLQATIVLGELALNAGRYDVAQGFFSAATAQQSTIPRSYAGLADSLRMQEQEDLAVNLDDYYQQALTLGPEDPDTLLDFGEYLETVLLDCDRTLSAAARQMIKNDMLGYFRKALELVPENAEANLAMGQYYLLEGEAISAGLPYQQRALALLPADSFIMEQTIRYLIELEQFDEAERLLGELTQPLHFFGEPEWVGNLRDRMSSKKQGTIYDVCAQ